MAFPRGLPARCGLILGLGAALALLPAAHTAESRPGDLRAHLAHAGPVARFLGHLGRPGERLARRLYGVAPGVRLGPLAMEGRFPAEVRAEAEKLGRALYRPARDATIDRASGAVLPDVPGQRLDVEATVRAVLRARAREQVTPILRPVPARWRRQDLARLTTVLGHYRTWLHGSWGRQANIVKAASRLNNRLILPGEVFSTLAALGPPAKKEGWHVAPVIIGGAYAEGVGGGICQVSSTLFNAVDRAGLRIVERHHHALRVHYVPPGRDATVAWPAVDFRFANSRRTPVLLKAWVSRGALHVAVLGDPTG